MNSTDKHNKKRFGQAALSVALAVLAVGACIGAVAVYRRTVELNGQLEGKRAEYDAVIAEKNTLIETITEQGQTLTDLDIEKRDAENRLKSLEDALK